MFHVSEVYAVEPSFSELNASFGEMESIEKRPKFDRKIDSYKFISKGELAIGLTASYGSATSENSEFMLIAENINASGTMASFKPFLGYFYNDNKCVGLRLGYSHLSGKIDSASLDFGESNGLEFDLPYIDVVNDVYNYAIFHRSYTSLDKKGRFGLFAEVELIYKSGHNNMLHDFTGATQNIRSNSSHVGLNFNPGITVFVLPNVSSNVSFGLGGLGYTSITQRNENGEVIGRRESSQLRFKFNIAEINFGITVHLWGEKLQK